MDIPLTPSRCSPLDFINPFPPFLQTSIVCTGLLLATTALLLFIWHGSRQALQQQWLGYAIRTICLLVLAGTLWSLGLSAWLWAQSSSFIPWCALVFDRLLPQSHALQAAQSIVPMTGTITMALLIAGATAMALLLNRETRSEHRGVPLETEA
jgi:lysylphosphatidylglycerol synthetase-like protein (DUF2156 family)